MRFYEPLSSYMSSGPVCQVARPCTKGKCWHELCMVACLCARVCQQKELHLQKGKALQSTKSPAPDQGDLFHGLHMCAELSTNGMQLVIHTVCIQAEQIACLTAFWYEASPWVSFNQPCKATRQQGDKGTRGLQAATPQANAPLRD